MFDGKPILVTGAGGFIGARMVEVLHGLGEKPVAGIRRWGTAARVARLPIDIVPCDIVDREQISSAMTGAGAVVHCAKGSSEVTVEGTRNILEAAQSNGVKRVVFLSTIAVYSQSSGRVIEDASTELTGNAYGDSKIEAEAVCREYMRRGLEVVILRPTIVYGPFGDLWTIEFAQRLPVKPWPFPSELCQGTCNLVYVDDLVSATMLALRRPEAVGETYNVNGPDRPTWNEYFVALNEALGLPPITTNAAGRSRLNAMMGKPVRVAAKAALRNFEPQIMGLYQRSRLAKGLMKGMEGWIRKTPTTGEFDLYGRVVSYPTSKLEAQLGYHSQFGMEEGIVLSVAWLRLNGYARAPEDRPVA